jgi:hypothetical protein
VPESFLYIIVDALSGHDVACAGGAEYVTAESAMVFPAEEGYEYFLAALAPCDIFVVDPPVSRAQQLPDRCRLIHYF